MQQGALTAELRLRGMVSNSAAVCCAAELRLSSMVSNSRAVILQPFCSSEHSMHSSLIVQQLATNLQ
jgi:hypothetical protein